MRSMGSILSDEPSLHTLPEGPEGEPSSEPGTETEAEQGATPEPAEAKKADAKPKQEAKPAVGDDDDESDKLEPRDLEGFKKALAAARGDKRKERKKWQEAERKLAEFEGRHRALEQMQQRQQEQRDNLARFAAEHAA